MIFYGIMIAQSMSISTSIQHRDQLSDEEVLRLSLHHPDIFSLLVERYEKPFYRRARVVVKVHEDAEEVVQDTFTRIYLFADRYHPQEGAQFSSWAYTILNRVAFTRYQKLKHHNMAIVSLNPKHYESLPDVHNNVLEKLAARDEVLYAFSQLPESASRILKLQFFEGNTQKEIAQLEGISISATKARVHRAKKLFARMFK